MLDHVGVDVTDHERAARRSTLTENSELSALFAGAAGLSIWFILSGIRTARRLSAGEINPEVGMAVAQ